MIKSKDGSPTITVKELEEYLNLLPPDMLVTAGIAKEGIDLFDSKVIDGELNLSLRAF